MDCPTCGVAVSEKRKKRNARYCSTACRKKATASFYRKEGLNLSTATIGTIQELRVSADLLAKGASVFRALSPSCPCDLVVLAKERLIRIEVTTGYKNANGNRTHPSKDHGNYDMLAVVFYDGSIVYEPPLDSLGLDLARRK